MCKLIATLASLGNVLLRDQYAVNISHLVEAQHGFLPEYQIQKGTCSHCQRYALVILVHADEPWPEVATANGYSDACRPTTKVASIKLST